VSSTVGLLDSRTVTGCGLHVLGLWEASASGVLRICVRITYVLRVRVRIFGAPCRQTFVSFEHLEEYLDERVRKTTDYAYST
jgi:hypothetical protein